MTFHSAMESVLFSYALGLGVMSFSLFIFGVTGILYRQTVHLFLIIVLLGSLPVLYSGIRDRSFFKMRSIQLPRRPFITCVLLLIIGIYVGLTFITALTPPTEFDSQVYNLADSKRFLRYNSLLHTQMPGVDLHGVCIMPLGFELLYAVPLSLDHDVAAKLLQWATAICAAIAIYALMARFFSRIGGLFAAAIFLIQPAVARFIATPKADMAVVLFAVLSLYAFFEWNDSRERKWLICCGVNAGLFAACRLYGFF
ncbi:glycosyltransferase family 39 protein, partial [Candidatus Omnitrophota bacterium]